MKTPHHTPAPRPHPRLVRVGRAPRATPERRNPRTDIRTDTAAASTPGRVAPRPARAAMLVLLPHRQAFTTTNCSRPLPPPRLLPLPRAQLSVASTQPRHALSSRASSLPSSTRRPAVARGGGGACPRSRARTRAQSSALQLPPPGRTGAGGGRRRRRRTAGRAMKVRPGAGEGEG